MPILKLTATLASSALLVPLLTGCTAELVGSSPGSGASATGVPTPTGGSGVGGSGSNIPGVGGSGTTTPTSSKPAVDVITIRRLNRTEYNNTLRDLTGTARLVGNDLPPDNLSFGFDNIGEALTVQPLHIELFEKGADAVLDELFARPATDALRTKVLACDAQTGHACVNSTVLTFAERAFRRPVTEAEIAPFVSIADMFTQTGGSAADGLKLALKGVLLSPHFLFRVELDASPTSKDPHRLSAFELATRLSYYLWSTMPDDTLYAAAKSGALNDDAKLATEVTRMLGQPQAKALIDNFGGQWLNVRRVANVKPDDVEYPSFNAELAASMQTESLMFFAELVDKGRPITELLTSDFSYVDAKLAAFYGIAAPASGFQRVQLGASHRLGFLTQASFLTLTSNPTRTSPVKRGKWVLDQLLCSPPPPPPPGVDTSLGDVGATTSLRARLEAHRAKEPCKSCHAVMDPIGLSFENFDGVGTYRTADQFGPIDATGTLPTDNGDISFQGASQLVPVLAQDARVAKCAAEKVLTYAIGRGYSLADEGTIQAVLTSADATNQGLRGLFAAVASSESFRSRRAVGE
jgi:hypothetical protein